MTVGVAHGEYQAALRSDFYSFMLRCFTDLNGAAYLPSWRTSRLWRPSLSSACGTVASLD